METDSKTQIRKSRQLTRDGFVYLTKRILMSSAKSAGKVAAKNAMEVMGFVVTVKDGWVVRKYADGRIERIEKLGA